MEQFFAFVALDTDVRTFAGFFLVQFHIAPSTVRRNLQSMENKRISLNGETMNCEVYVWKEP